ncbi:hypothetical protein M501DRAFT_1002762 [Patellaria atrata CBS 101060]|uniref:Nucleoporin Nup54 alpha-helical domain-containing protein n=1 Tax=Patellaria atrata CBS 101060 TaxID=1346257 RepID=A0A9P4SCX7_9PEZI|nr:hypothetical protein M501DRAFT_1002762 [Patellaria atrata CBS 101060]
MFSNTAQGGSSLFGGNTANKPLGLFATQPATQPNQFLANSQQNNAAPGNTGLFGVSQQQPQQQGLSNSLLSSQQGLLQNSLQRSGVWNAPPGPAREKSITEQMQIIFEKWSPESPNSYFHYYFYNSVEPSMVHHYGPGQNEDEKKWEDALARKPYALAIPIIAKGFRDVAKRLEMQVRAVGSLQARMHEINASLTRITQQHDLEISVRAVEARRKHIILSQRCLSLASKVQVLRNRGYAMDSMEEELKRKLVDLEKAAFDPNLNGRQEEMWARMSAIRTRADYLQQESEKLGKNLENSEETIDEDTMKKVKQLLNDFDSQLAHLRKEVEKIGTDFKEWEKSVRPQ